MELKSKNHVTLILSQQFQQGIDPQHQSIRSTDYPILDLSQRLIGCQHITMWHLLDLEIGVDSILDFYFSVKDLDDCLERLVKNETITR